MSFHPQQTPRNPFTSETMPRVPAVVFSAPSITGGESSGAASGSSTADGTSPSTDNHCERNHKFYAKVSIDFGLLITTLVQMRVVVGEDRKKDYMMVYLLYLFIAISLAVQIAVLLAYVSLHVRNLNRPCWFMFKLRICFSSSGITHLALGSSSSCRREYFSSPSSTCSAHV